MSSPDALAPLDASLARLVEDMTEVLAADVPAFLRRTVRRSFADSETSDRLDDAGLAALKGEVARESEAAGAELRAQLTPDAWLWPGPEAPPADAHDLQPNLVVSGLLAGVSARIEALLDRHGLPPAGDLGVYKLPSYFVAGRMMKSLVESYWKTLAHRHEIASQLEEESGVDRRRERESRWDQA